MNTSFIYFMPYQHYYKIESTPTLIYYYSAKEVGSLTKLILFPFIWIYIKLYLDYLFLKV